jgi:16S rRNA (guanine527-N7)-methyltransferase
LQVTCLDSMTKRVNFVEQAAAVANIRNVTACCGRAEALARQADLRDAFDVVTARAVAEARVLAELCLPFVATGGIWVAAKGPDPQVRSALMGCACTVDCCAADIWLRFSQ